VKAMEIEAYVDNAGNSPLVEKDLKAAKIIESSDIEGFGAKSYTLENGAKVVILPTDYSKDEIGLSAFSFGGTSLISNKDIVSAAVVSSLTNLSGLGEFDATQLEKKLTGKIAYVSPQLDEIVEGLQGSASPKDFETFMQLVYLSFENPRFDREAFDAQVAKWNEQAINSKVDNASALKDSIILANSNYSDRTFLFNEEAINRINYERAVEIYKERFTDASDFTFIFVGNINTEEHLPMIQKYIGNISSTNRKESFVDHKIGPAKGITSNIFERKMTVPKTTVSYNLQGDFKYSLKNKMMVNIISQLLSKRYMVTIREEEGGSYGVRVGHSVSKLPSAEYSISIKFDGDPEKSARLTEIVKEEITKLTKESCNADDLTEIKNNFIKNREEQELQNYFWMNALENKLMENENFTNKEKYNQLVNSIDSKAILKFAKKILKEANRVEVIMNPEK